MIPIAPACSGTESSGLPLRHGPPRQDPVGRPTPTACASESTSVDRAPATPPPCPTSPSPTWPRHSSACASSAARSSTPAIGGPFAGTPRAARSRWPPHPHPGSSTRRSLLAHNGRHVRGRPPLLLVRSREGLGREDASYQAEGAARPRSRSRRSLHAKAPLPQADLDWSVLRPIAGKIDHSAHRVPAFGSRESGQRDDRSDWTCSVRYSPGGASEPSPRPGRSRGGRPGRAAAPGGCPRRGCPPRRATRPARSRWTRGPFGRSAARLGRRGLCRG